MKYIISSPLSAKIPELCLWKKKVLLTGFTNEMRQIPNMRGFNSLLCLIILLAGYSCRTSRMPESVRNTELFDTGIIRRDITILAADSFKGRNAPGRELDLAADYIVHQLNRPGIQLYNQNGFQLFNLCTRDLGPENSLTITKNSIPHSFALRDDFTPFEQTPDTTLEAAVVFAGYGISAPEFQYNDYENLDVKGKIVLCFRNEPMVGDTLRKFSEEGSMNYSSLETKMLTAMKYGATGMLIVNEPAQFKTLRARGFPWPALSKIIPREAQSPALCDLLQKRIPLIHVGTEVIKTLFGSVDSLRNLQKRIDTALKPFSFPVQASVKIQSDILTFPVPTRNVIAYIEGADSLLKNEILVIGAHYDHIGAGKARKAGKDGKDGSDSIYNGADDNASGTTGLIAVANAFAKMSQKPARSVVFVAFSAEEKGLLGSSWFVNHPPFPDKKIIAMLNMDMIGRNGDNLLWLIGTRESPDITKIVTRQNKITGFTLLKERGGLIGGSDHYSFYKKDIPFMFFFTGFHDDYHQTGDQSEKINVPKLTNVARLVFLTAWQIANENNLYRLDPDTNP